MANEVSIIVKMSEDITDPMKSMTGASKALNKEFEALPGAVKGHKKCPPKNWRAERESILDRTSKRVSE